MTIRIMCIKRETTVLYSPFAPARERIGCSQERGEIDACIDAHIHHLRRSGQPLRRNEPTVVRQEHDGLLRAHSMARWWMHQAARPSPMWIPIVSVSRLPSRSDTNPRSEVQWSFGFPGHRSQGERCASERGLV
jgi:hypothetical protein